MRLHHLFLVACCGALAAAVQAAGELEHVQQLRRDGRIDAALAESARHLAEVPRDVEMRFLQAHLLGDAGRVPEAIEVLQRLSQEFPNLPEPHNNLAALYAGSGEFDRAREALEQALRLNPGFATAQENLGDVHAALAARAYAAAQRLDPQRAATLARKLDLVRQLTAPVAGTPAPAPASLPAAAAVP